VTDLASEIANRAALIENCDLALACCAAHPEACLTLNAHRDRYKADLAALQMQADNIAREAGRQLDALLAR
jgi:hypothetical protein